MPSLIHCPVSLRAAEVHDNVMMHKATKRILVLNLELSILLFGVTIEVCHTSDKLFSLRLTFLHGRGTSYRAARCAPCLYHCIRQVAGSQTCHVRFTTKWTPQYKGPLYTTEIRFNICSPFGHVRRAAYLLLYLYI